MVVKKAVALEDAMGKDQTQKEKTDSRNDGAHRPHCKLHHQSRGKYRDGQNRNHGGGFGKRKNRNRGENGNKNREDESGTKRNKLTCLLPRCNGTHMINDCPNATPAEVKRYVAEYIEQKKASKGEKDARKTKRGPDGRRDSEPNNWTIIQRCSGLLS